MQFLPSTWKTWGVDGNRDGRKDPYNPVDAIFAAARYLKAAGADKDIHRAIFAYNHAGWYVDSVMLRARLIAGVPPDVIGSLSGLTEGRFPVYAHARYADDIAIAKSGKKVDAGHNAARLIESSAKRKGINIFARKGAPVIAVNDGVIKKIGTSKKLGRYVVLQDVYGNQYTYSQLGSLARVYPVPKSSSQAEQDPGGRAAGQRHAGRHPRPGRPGAAAADHPGREPAEAHRARHRRPPEARAREHERPSAAKKVTKTKKVAPASTPSPAPAAG